MKEVQNITVADDARATPTKMQHRLPTVASDAEKSREMFDELDVDSSGYLEVLNFRKQLILAHCSLLLNTIKISRFRTVIRHGFNFILNADADILNFSTLHKQMLHFVDLPPF